MSSQNDAIKVVSLSKSFGKKKILDSLSFNVPNNAIAGFLGPNGAGKTTTLRMLLGLLPAPTGKIELLGHKIPEERALALERIGAVVENPSFIDTMTAFENLYWFGSLYLPVEKNRIHEVIKLVGLKEAANQRFGTFSTGMKQRLGVAFSLLHKPELLILDEPTSGMDPSGRYQMREILLNIHEKEKTSIFLSSHLLDEVQKLCNYVVIINKGQMITEGFVSDILASSEERYEIRVADELIDSAKSILEGAKNIVKSVNLAPRGFIVDIENDTSHLINELLVKAGIKVQALIPLESSLEETFIKLTEKNKANNFSNVSIKKDERTKESEAVQEEDKEAK
ncbi:MAG: ABC transporter ATP-binding protein [Candidatus Riflebacteria bacterium]|nr:ABC transporter ATP-binding protein [Candidatus Riflebacteria bacterium]